MVSFTCNVCQDVVKKPKVVGHASSCGSHSFTCVDCMQVFDLNTIKPHTTCVSEVEKYQGKWLQKNRGTNGTAKKNLDSSDEDEAGGKAKAKPDGLQRPPRATMDDLDTDSDDDDWLTSKKSKKDTSASAGKKRPRPGGVASSDDEDDGEARLVEVAKKSQRAAHAAAKSPKPKVRTPAAAPTEKHKKHTPLILPRSTATTECEVPAFVLDSVESLTEIVKDILAHEANGATGMKKKDLAKALVTRYMVRIAKKGVVPAVDAAVQLGGLAEDAHGNVHLA